MNPITQFSLSIYLRFLPLLGTGFYYVIMPSLVVSLHTSIQNVKLTVAIFFLGFTMSVFFSGSIIDQWGERKSYWCSVGICVLGSLICIFSDNVNSMMLGRCLQGLSFGVVKVLSKTLIANVRQAKWYDMYMIFKALGSAISMLLTSLILVKFSWRMSFVFILIWVFLFMPLAKYLPDSSCYSHRKNLFSQFKYYTVFFYDPRFLPLILS